MDYNESKEMTYNGGFHAPLSLSLSVSLCVMTFALFDFTVCEMHSCFQGGVQ
jgi:hypothetical protein